MSEAKLDITGDSATAQRALDKATRETAKLRETIRKMNEESASGFKKSSAGVNDFVSRLSSAAAVTDKWKLGMDRLNASSAPFRRNIDTFKLSFAGVSSGTSSVSEGMLLLATRFAGIAGPAAVAAGAMAILRREYAAYTEQAAAAAEKHKNFQDELSRQISTGFDASRAAEVERFVGSVPGVTKETAMQALHGVSSEMQGTSFERRAGIAKSIARLGVTGRDIGPQGAGGLAGFLGQDVIPGYKSEDVADVAALIQREAGGDIEKLGGDNLKRSLQQLITAGMSPEEAIGTAVAAARSDVSGRTLSQLAKTAAASKEQLRPSAGATGKIASAQRRLANMTGRERIQAMLSDKAMAEAGIGESAIELGDARLSMKDIQSTAAMVAGVKSEDVIAGQLKGMEKSEAGRGRATRYATQVQQEQAAEAITRRDTLLAEADALARAQFAGIGFVGHLAGEASVGFRKVATATGQMYAGTDEQSLRELRLVVEAMRRSAAALEEQSRKQNQPRNIDAHTE